MARSPYTLGAAFRRQRVLVAALAVVALGVVPLGVLWSVSAAGYVLGSLLLVLAVARVVVPEENLGALVNRRRWIDVLIMVALAFAILLLAGTPNL